MSLRKIFCTTSAVFTTLTTAAAQNKTGSETSNDAANKAMEYAFLYGFLPVVTLSFISFSIWELRKILHQRRMESNTTHISSDLQEEESNAEQPSFHPDVALATGRTDSAPDEPIELVEVDLNSSTERPRP